MYSKVINPARHGKVVYQNKSSSLRLANYLKKEASKDDLGNSTKLFFNAQGSFDSKSVVEAIDNNVKGLRKEDDKFYALVIAPSKDELEHIDNSKEKLKLFTIACMEKYAANFRLNAKIDEKELVWFATIHHDRHYKGNDPEVLAGEKRQGEKKAGLQTHIHVVVSSRDKSQTITLNPLTLNKSRFLMTRWFDANQRQFCRQFDYAFQPEKVFENLAFYEKSVHWQIAKLEKMGLSVEQLSQIRAMAVEKNYSQEFRKNLAEISKTASKNTISKEVLDWLKSTKKDSKKHQNLDKTAWKQASAERIFKTLDKRFKIEKQDLDFIKQVGKDTDYSFSYLNKLKTVLDNVAENQQEKTVSFSEEQLKILENSQPYQSKIEPEFLLNTGSFKGFLGHLLSQEEPQEMNLPKRKKKHKNLNSSLEL